MMLPFVTIDFETRSFCDLTECGAWAYSMDKTTEIVCAAWKFSDSDKIYFTRNNNYDSLKDFKGPIVSHNYQFEYAMISNILVKKEILPKSFLDLKRYRCTMASALRVGLMGSLHNVCNQLNIKEAKKASLGSKLVQKFSKPYTNRKKGIREFREITEKDWEDYRIYNVFDVKATEKIYHILPKLHEDFFEAPLFELDKIINANGLNIDVVALNKLIKIYEENNKELIKEAEKLAGKVELSDVLIVSSPIELKRWINKRLKKSQYIYDAQQKTLSDLQKITKNKEILKAIELRQALSKTSAKKIYKFKSYSINGVIRDYMQYAGAHTLRWAGRGVQPHNFPRESVDNFKKTLTELEKGEYEPHEVPKTINSLLRQLIIPSKGNRFLIGDFSAIEARISFWLANCKPALNAYKNEEDIYINMASSVYKKPCEEITVNQRFVGKIAILGMCYGMGVNRFLDVCKSYNINMKEELAYHIVMTYRETYPEIVELWYHLENAFIQAMESPNMTYKLELNETYLSVIKSGGNLKVRLPSGRIQYYVRPSYNRGAKKITIFHPKKKLLPIWGGSILENIVQATARDLMAEAMLKCHRNDMTPVLTVHDEIVCETPKNLVKEKIKQFKNIMTTPPEWALSLPLDAECKSTNRYCKI